MQASLQRVEGEDVINRQDDLAVELEVIGRNSSEDFDKFGKVAIEPLS